jgi:plastocyanin
LRSRRGDHVTVSRKRGLCACLVVAALAMPGCGGDDDSAAPPPTVVLTDEGYEPADLEVPVGSEVRFVNRAKQSVHSAKDSTPGPVDPSPKPGSSAHDGSEVNRASHKGFATHALFPNETQRVRFPVADVYEYYCSFHADMKGRIVVVE